MAKKTNLQVMVERRTEADGNSLDEELCGLLDCDKCPHDKGRHYPYACCYGLFNDMFSTDQDAAEAPGTED